MWETKVHVQSSMVSKDSQYELFIGRWQSPNGLHDGHKALFSQVLDRGDKLCIAIREGETNEKNPFTAEEVFKNITVYYQNQILSGQVRVIIIPDICSVNFGRGVGYDIIEYIPPAEIADISATKIREEMRKSGKL
jgi:nicotinamide mononucleotide adenylyltransferase